MFLVALFGTQKQQTLPPARGNGPQQKSVFLWAPSASNRLLGHSWSPYHSSFGFSKTAHGYLRSRGSLGYLGYLGSLHKEMESRGFIYPQRSARDSSMRSLGTGPRRQPPIRPSLRACRTHTCEGGRRRSANGQNPAPSWKLLVWLGLQCLMNEMLGKV